MAGGTDTLYSQSLYSFKVSIGKWRRRFHSHELGPEGSYERYHPFVRATWKVLKPEIDCTQQRIEDLLAGDTVRKSLLLEGEEDTRDKVARLFAIYERFLQELRDEVICEQPLGISLRERLGEGSGPNPKSGRSLLSDPVRNILPVPKGSVGIIDIKRDLMLKHNEEEAFSITEVGTEDKLTWNDWHGFLYAIRNTDGHGKLQPTLKDKGCLPEERRKRIRKFLKTIVDGDTPKDKTPKNWATDMIRLLRDMEFRLSIELGSTAENCGIIDPVTSDLWVEFKKRQSKSAPFRTEFEENLSYAVKLWMPRMTLTLARALVEELKDINSNANPGGSPP